MPDYSACLNNGCASRHDCGRYRMSILEGHRQTFGSFCPPEGADRCENFFSAEKAPFRVESADAAQARNEAWARQWSGARRET